jgi:hypothetical protein
VTRSMQTATLIFAPASISYSKEPLDNYAITDFRKVSGLSCTYCI